MALPITIPYTFSNATVSIPLTNLDSDFSVLVNAINGIGNGSVSLTSVSITGGSITGVPFIPRVLSATTATSLTPTASYDQYEYTALASALTINAATGTFSDGQKMIFRILDNGTSQTLSWNANFYALGITLPVATTAGKTTYVGCIYNSNNSRWDAVATTTG